MEAKRVTLFAGHYGSGKTNIAINYAEWLRASGRQVTVADLDIVNPYFRTQDSRERLLSQGIGLIVSPFAGSNLDAPAMPAETYALLSDPACSAVLDVGGDERGALALGRYSRSIREEGDYEMLFVLNTCRPLTRTVEEALEVMGEIEEACSLPFTALVHNSNLGPHTDAETVLTGAETARALSARTGLPIKMHCAGVSICRSLEGMDEPVFPLRLQRLYYQLMEGDKPWQN
ncbi:MAG: hypothetical protein KBS46_05735 [Clostridiales bacterium]|nr:hypothetical protein [Candidatus Apopatocola equi]